MKTQHVLVTGGGRGIGLGIVKAMAEAGFNVTFCGRSPRPDTVLQELETAYPIQKFSYVNCDVSSAADRERLLREAEAAAGPVDVLVNNAGVAPRVRCDLLEMPEESFDRLIAINLRGPFFLTQLVARQMVERGSTENFRCIINIGSVSADYASINRGEYCLSKAGVAMATKLWAVRLAEINVPVYELRPGVIQSDMTNCVKEKYDKMIADGLTLQKRWGFPSDVGHAAAMLASGHLAYSTGQVINVDGGLTVERF